MVVHECSRFLTLSPIAILSSFDSAYVPRVEQKIAKDAKIENAKISFLTVNRWDCQSDTLSVSSNSRMKNKADRKPQAVPLGEYIVADPAICHGKPTFKGTRVMVYQVLEQVAYGTPWERIVWSWRGKVPMEAITEAVRLASEQFKEKRFFKSNATYRREHLRDRNLAAA